MIYTILTKMEKNTYTEKTLVLMQFLSPKQTYDNLLTWCFIPVKLSLLKNVSGSPPLESSSQFYFNFLKNFF